MSLARIAHTKQKSLHTFHEHPFLINCQNLCRFWHGHYIFTGICHSVNGGGAAPRGKVPAPGGCGACSQGGLPATRGVPAPGGVSASGGCLLPGGGGGARWRPPGRPLLRALRILLECILFLKIFYESVQLTTIIIVIIVITIGCRQETDFIDVILFSQVYFIPEPIMIETPGTQMFGFLKNKYIRVFWIFQFTEVCSGIDSFPTVLGKGPCEYQKSRIA